MLARRFKERRDGLQALLNEYIDIGRKIDDGDMELFDEAIRLFDEITNLIVSGAADFIDAKKVLLKQAVVLVSTAATGVSTAAAGSLLSSSSIVGSSTTSHVINNSFSTPSSAIATSSTSHVANNSNSSVVDLTSGGDGGDIVYPASSASNLPARDVVVKVKVEEEGHTLSEYDDEGHPSMTTEVVNKEEHPCLRIKNVVNLLMCKCKQALIANPPDYNDVNSHGTVIGYNDETNTTYTDYRHFDMTEDMLRIVELYQSDIREKRTPHEQYQAAKKRIGSSRHKPMYNYKADDDCDVAKISVEIAELHEKKQQRGGGRHRRAASAAKPKKTTTVVYRDDSDDDKSKKDWSEDDEEDEFKYNEGFTSSDDDSSDDDNTKPAKKKVSVVARKKMNTTKRVEKVKVDSSDDSSSDEDSSDEDSPALKSAIEAQRQALEKHKKNMKKASSIKKKRKSLDDDDDDDDDDDTPIAKKYKKTRNVKSRKKGSDDDGSSEIEGDDDGSSEDEGDDPRGGGGGVVKRYKTPSSSKPLCSGDNNTCMNQVQSGGVCRRHGAKKPTKKKTEKKTKKKNKKDSAMEALLAGAKCGAAGKKRYKDVNGRKRPLCSGDNNTCNNQEVQGGLCTKHGAKRKKCSHPGCKNMPARQGVCVKHGATYDPCVFVDASGKRCTLQKREGQYCKAHNPNKKMCKVCKVNVDTGRGFCDGCRQRCGPPKR